MIRALLVLLLGCGSPPPPEPLVLLVTVDTTRADILGCYGDPGDATTTMDSLAGRGVRFALALAHAPTTLSSHASMFSGQDPHGHGIPRNGAGVPQDLPLLSERLAGAGYDTLAVVGASVLGADQGLSRGFRRYDDTMSTRVRRRYEDDAASVTTRALNAIDQREAGKPVFLWVHYYDPHMPWNSASPELVDRFVDKRYRGIIAANPRALTTAARRGRHGGVTDADRAQARGYYRAEVAAADAGLAGLLAGLEARGLLAESLVVLTADHGESLGETNSSEVFGHGLDVDAQNIHVPLIVAGRGRFQTPVAVVDRQVRLMDVGATVLSVVGVGGGLGQGEDLSPLWKGQTWPAPLSFAEANKPMDRAEDPPLWNNLRLERSVSDGAHLLVWTPWRSLGPWVYAWQPGLPQISDLEVREPLLRALQGWDAAAPQGREVEIDAATQEMLRALGYAEEDERDRE